MLSHVWAFVALSVVVICTPGPDTALTVRNSLSGGRRAGVYTGLGVAAGQLVWTLAAGVGVAGVLVASERAFEVVKIVGAVYLIVLGTQSLVAAVRRRGHSEVAEHPAGLAAGRALRQGLVNDLANPKMAAFFLSLLPQFVTKGTTEPLQLLGLGALFCLMTFLWLCCYALLIDRARRLLQRNRVRRAIDAVAGGVLVAFGVRLATPA
jgi:RhtB (resistance to homoserine/threonine) family protein